MLPSRRLPGTHWKINGWLIENHLFAKEKHLNQTFIIVLHVNFEGCVWVMGINPQYEQMSSKHEKLWENSKKFNSIHTVMGWIILNKILNFLVGGFNPFEKYARQIGEIFPNFRGENKKNISNHHPVLVHVGSKFSKTIQATKVSHPTTRLLKRLQEEWQSLAWFLLENTTVWSRQFYMFYSKCRY